MTKNIAHDISNTKTTLIKVENNIYQMLLCALVVQSVKNLPAMWKTWV